jgi:hypothetical protein
MAKTPPKGKSAGKPAVDQWQAHDALHTLKRAHEIKNDPNLMHHVREHARKDRAALTKVIGRKPA